MRRALVRQVDIPSVIHGLFGAKIRSFHFLRVLRVLR